MSSLTRHYIGSIVKLVHGMRIQKVFFSLDLRFSSLEIKRLIEQDI